MLPFFTSRDERFRTPFGAVAEGTAVGFRICLPRGMGCHGAFLLHRHDDGLPEWDGMFWAGMEGDDHEWWDCHFTPESADLYWYMFALDTTEGRRYLCCLPDGQAELSDDKRGWWQLTCYRKDFVTPDWLVGGVMYQVFPDRFAASGEPKTGVPDDRKCHPVWGEQPEWRPDEQGVVRNNDYFGGDLKGIEAHLDRLTELGVTCLYLNPIFEAHSNHRYDTADYRKIDPLLGTEEDFRHLTAAARKKNIRIMLDGVFSHTGADSRYFNRNHRYPEDGAFQSLASPFAEWYHFDRWPNGYHGWWGFPTLPEVNELNPSFLHYITGEGGVIQHWLRAGASAWRLDVADELPDEFIRQLRQRTKATDAQAMVLGEVWEDASNKQSYGHRRRYLLGGQLDSVMNYPFRDAVLGFMTGEDGKTFFRRVMAVLENYPPQVIRILMNHIGTHDTERALTVLAGEPVGYHDRKWQSCQVLSPEQRRLGIQRMKLTALLQFCLPGVPCIYYGDEAGMEGYKDPFNRGCYPWGEEEAELLDWYRQLGQLRREPVFRENGFRMVYAGVETVAFVRFDGGESLLCAVNRAAGERTVILPVEFEKATFLLGSGWIAEGVLHLSATSCALLKKSW